VIDFLSLTSKAMQQHMTTQTNDQDQRELKLLRQLKADNEFFIQASRSITTLESQRKDVTRIYGERIKKLRSLLLILQQRKAIGQLSIEGIDSIDITPELKSLVYNPVGDLS
jgi:hypothetical protein